MFTEIGKRLKQAREQKGITLKEAAQATYIRLHYLEALENGDLDSMPSHAQARGFLRTYARYLGFEGDQFFPQSALEETTPIRPAERSDPVVVRPLAQTSLEADALFAAIGADLRQRRETLGLSLDDVELHSRIPIHYLKFLEAGQLENFPSPVQARGMLSNYAQLLELNSDQLLLRFAEGLQARLTDHQAQRQKSRPPTRRSQAPSWLRNFFTTELMIVVIVVLVLGFFGTWALSRVLSTQDSQSTPPTAPPLAEILMPSLTPTLTPVATETAAFITEGETQLDAEETILDANPTSASTGNVQVSIVVRQRAYLRVIVDGQTQFDGQVIPGSAYAYSGEERIEILTGNAAAIQIFFNQTDMGPLGIFGEVVNLIYTSNGLQTPTATITATPAVTATPTVTSSPSPTESP